MTIAIRPEAGPSREYHFPRFTRTTLDNGLTIIVARVAKLPLVSVAAVLDATALSDPSGKEGVAQLAARGLKEGTTSRSGGKLALDLEKLGTSLETGADWDGTIVSMTVLSQNMTPAFEILAEVLESPAYRQEDLDRIKAERLAERIQLLDEPRGLADESFARFIYSNTARYSRPLGGTSATVSSIDRNDVVQFHRDNYSPAAMTLIFAGDVTTDDAVALAGATLGSWKGGTSPKHSGADVAARNHRAVRVIAKPDAAQSELRIGHAGIPRTHPDYFPVVVMNAVLGGLFSSRINLNLREAHGYTYGASSHFDWRRQSGPFEISTAVQSEVTAEAIAETLKEIERMRSEEISPDELSLATSYLDGVFPIRYETTASIASALANMVTFGLPENYFDTYRGKIKAVTAREVLDAARTQVRPEELQFLVVGNPEIVQAPIEALSLGELSVLEAEP